MNARKSNPTISDRPRPRGYRQIIVGILVVLLCGWISHSYLQVLLVRGDSMAPTYRNLTFVLLRKNVHSFARSDVVAFHHDQVQGVLIKRIVGLPGDSLVIRDDALYINGERAPFDGMGYAGLLSTPVTLGETEYFMLGDNYPESRDSRDPDIGIIRYDQIAGAVCPQRQRP